MNKNYTTRNFNVLSIKDDFKLFHDYLIDYDVLEEEKQYHFDIINLSNEGKLNMLADCIYELSMFKNRIETSTEKFQNLEIFLFKTMIVNVLEIIYILKPYVIESEFLNKMNVKNYYMAVIDNIAPRDIKHKTKEYDILELLDYFNKKEKEYDTKASFYTDKKTNEEKHYTEKDWFIVGSKFVDGTVYDCKKIYESGLKLVELIFKDEFEKLEKEEIKTLKNRYRNPINGSLETFGFEDRTLFKKGDKYEKQWRLICDYQKKQGKQIDSRFAEQFLKVYGVPIE